MAEAFDPARRHVRVHQHEGRVLVWQAHGHELADACLALGRYGGAHWSLSRHTRFRLSLPSLLARTGQGVRDGRERTLGVWLPRDLLVGLLEQAVHRRCELAVYGSLKRWRLAARYAQVSIEWHPDHARDGEQLADETLRVGVRQAALAQFTEGVVSLEDWTGRIAAGASWPSVERLPLSDQLRRRLSGEG